MSGSPYAPNMQNQGFNAGPPPAPLNVNVNGNGMPTPQMLNGIPATSSTSNTPIRPTFTPQHSSLVGNPFERRESGDFQIYSKPTAEPQATEREAGFALQNSIAEPFVQQHQQSEVGLSENVIEPVRKEPEPQQTANPVNEETPMQVDPQTSNEVQMSENQPQEVAMQEQTGIIVARHVCQILTEILAPATKETPLQKPGSTAAPSEDLRMVDSFPKRTPTPPVQTETQETLKQRLESVRLAKREQAKQALRDLDKIDVGYQELAGEQVNTDLLKGLFLEAGLPVPDDRVSGVHNMAKDRISKGRSKDPLPSRAQVYSTGTSTVASVEKSRVEPLLQDNQVDSSMAGQAEKPASPHPSANAVNAASKGSTPQGGKVATPTESTDRSQGRKDYIARLLAAKAGKKQDVAPTPVKSGEPDSGPGDTKVQEVVGEITRPASAAQGAIETKKPEMKDPKQTELIRQRLEALKNSAKNQPQFLQNPPILTPPQTEQPQSIASQRLHNEIGTNDLAEKERNSRNGSTTVDPSRSFFAPTNRVPSGGLPGLPGLSGFALPGISTNKEPPIQPPAAASKTQASDYQEEDGEILSEEEQGQFVSTEGNGPTTEKPEKVTADPISLSTTPDSVKSVEKIVTASISAPEPSRKRPMAADFIDSPPRKAIRRPTSSEPIHLVIEVSDNEDENSISGSITTSTVPQVLRDQDINGRRGLGELPPLSDFPPRSAESISSRTPKVMTPLLTQREEEIRNIRKRIAEAESRRKAKGMGDTTAVASIGSPVPGEIALARTAETKQQAIKEVNEQLAEQEKALALAKREIQRKLEAERQNQARISALAEKERQQATNATTSAERQARLSRKATLEAALPDLDAQINAAMAKLEDMRRQQEEIQAEIQRGNAGRAALVNELNEILKALEVGNASPEPITAQNDDSMDFEESNKGLYSFLSDSLPELREEKVLRNAVSRPELDKATASETQEPAPRPSKIIIPKDITPDLKGNTLPTPQTARTEPGDVMDIASSSEDEGQIIESASSVTQASQEEDEAAVEETRESEGGEGSEEVETDEGVEEYDPAVIVPDAEPRNNIDRMSINDSQTKANEDYEPSLAIEIISSGSARSPAQDTDELSDQKELSPSYQGNIEDELQSHANPSSPSQTSLQQEEGEISEGEEVSDDYEPPEASYPVESTNSDALRSPSRSAIPNELDADDMAVDAEARRSAVAVPVDTTERDLEDGLDEDEAVRMSFYERSLSDPTPSPT